MMMGAVRRNPWSTLSLIITTGDALAIFALVRYLYWRGLWPSASAAHYFLSVWGGVAMLLSLGTATVALIKDASKGYALLALFLSLLSFLFYAQ